MRWAMENSPSAFLTLRRARALAPLNGSQGTTVFSRMDRRGTLEQRWYPPLANFGTVRFGLDNTGVGSTCYATIGVTTAAFGTFGSNVQKITMVTSGGATKASPSNPSSDNTSFSVTWVSSGP